ncbi:MAG: H(+)/Cl(-) exchange transporter ClcA [Chroococcidiopsis sp. SAG 2025]|uniref:chloride channel protein n=1 Tax=Chroococcidiopsis sp. SAG 2025 TaxID=171389 RepID=UPI0029370FEA|nr:chloride channel protein [Chroococcidiopsis sp. SAG 2025]MDV2992765.1 H(+)/Cl(-) exchange transporter ClcA [Chroococcidiopsis sp. SAG 2025]
MSALRQYLRHWMRPRRTSAIAEACLIGLVAAWSAVLLKTGSGWLGAMRVYHSNLLPAWILLPSVGLAFGYLSGLLVERLAPEASGSGIPHVKAVLANAATDISWRTAGVKLLASTLAIGSGLPIGRQGPTVHIGAALAAQFSRWVPTSPDHRRQMIAAGAGAGLAAAFNAPITGVLFVVEELLHDLSSLTLGTAILASFIGAVVSRILGGRSLDLSLVLTAHSTSFSLIELPFFLLLGILAGLLGSLFHRGIIASLKFYRQLHVSLSLRIALAGSISGMAIALLPPTFRDNSGLREFLITGDASLELAAIAFVAQFILTLVAFGSGAPGGLFAPSLIIGSALGYMVGLTEFHILGIGSPATYALAGMGAFFSVVSKVPITAIAIVFEMTTDFNLVLPLMIGSVTAYLIAERLAPGSLYNKILQLKGINLESAVTPKGILAELTAEDVMQRRVETLGAQMTLDEAVQAFSRSHHRGFPVVDNSKLVGIITQTDLAKIRDRPLPGDTPISEVMTPQPVTVSPHATLAHVLYLLDRYQLSRLPVVENRRMVGIITRADIIRVEADKLSGETEQTGPQPEPSYIVYQTRSPSTGRGRILVPIANPQTAESLLQMAAAIARDRDYELECIQVILVSRRSSPAETSVRTGKSRKLLRQAEVIAKKQKIPVHTQIRVAHDTAQAILETIKEQHIDILLMGWKGNTITPGRIFGNVVDTLIRQAPCDVVLVKLPEDRQEARGEKQEAFSQLPSPTPSFNRWLVPMAGGPNAKAAIKLLPPLASLGEEPEIQLCQVFESREAKPDVSVLQQAIRYLVKYRQLSGKVTAVPVVSSSVADGLINLVKTEDFDVVVLGASREGMLQNAIKGNIPAQIANRVDSTVILVRGEIDGK